MAAAPHALSLLDLKQDIEVAYAFSPSEARRAAFASAYGFPVVGDIDAIFSDPTVDVVLILTPPNTHLELVRRAASVQKHVLLEKPAGLDPRQTEAMIETTQTNRVMLGVVFQNRFRQATEVLSDILAESRLGRIVGASARVRAWRPQSYYEENGRGSKARDGGGVLLTQAVHTLDLLIRFAGLPVKVAGFCTTSRVHRMETEDLVAMALQFDQGVLGTINATTCDFPGYSEQIDITGDQGTATIIGSRLIVRFHSGETVEVDDISEGGSGASAMAFPHFLHRALLIDFVDSVRNSRRPRATGEDALRAQCLIEAFLASSAKGGRAVSVQIPSASISSDGFAATQIFPDLFIAW
jgi:predicted dehydrogenase